MTKYLLLSLIIIFTVSCGTVLIKEPQRLENETYASYMSRYCRYAAAKGKYAPDCSKWDDAAVKEYMHDYCNDPKNLWNDEKPQNCWDKID